MRDKLDQNYGNKILERTWWNSTGHWITIDSDHIWIIIIIVVNLDDWIVNGSLFMAGCKAGIAFIGRLQ